MVTFRFRGKPGQLEAIARKIGNADRAFDVLARNMGEETVELVRQGFNAQQNPYGAAWKKLKPETIRRKGSSRILVDNAIMRNSYALLGVARRAFTVGTTVFYALFHQEGKGFNPKRMMLPSKSRGIPAKWKARYRNIVTLVLEEATR